MKDEYKCAIFVTQHGANCTKLTKIDKGQLKLFSHSLTIILLTICMNGWYAPEHGITSSIKTITQHDYEQHNS